MKDSIVCVSSLFIFNFLSVLTLHFVFNPDFQFFCLLRRCYHVESRK